MWLGRIQALDSALQNRQAHAKEKLNLEIDISTGDTLTASNIEKFVTGAKDTGDLRNMFDFMQVISDKLKMQSRVEELKQLEVAAKGQITAACLLPVVLATIVDVVDATFDSRMIMRWITTALLPCTSYVLFTGARREPHTVAIVYLAQLVSGISGSVTTWWITTMALNNVVSPTLCYVHEDISDDTEVRWVLYGFILDLVYVLTLEILAFAQQSWWLLVLLPCWCLLVSTLAAIAIYDDRWEDNAHHRLQPLVRPTWWLSSVYRWTVQLAIFRINKFVKTKLAYPRGQATPQDVVTPEEFSKGYSVKPFKYRYHNLNNSSLENKGVFRLLRILKGKPGQIIACRLETVPSPDGVDYEAISYVWGPPPHSEIDILVDSQSLTITRTAYDIILRRRSQYRDRLIWIDQVCINQKDEVERSYQVQIMKAIYQGASAIVAYLGPSTDCYLLQAHFAELYWRQEVLGYSPEKLQESYRFGHKAAEWDAQLSFFAHPWFRRVWIIQEAVFARKLMLLYGDVCLDWNMVSRVLNVLFENQLLYTPQTNDEMMASQMSDDYQAGLHNLDSILEFRGDVRYGKAFDLAHVLEMSGRSIATDPRDKIYAVLGLTSDLSSNVITPEYGENITTAMVYKKAMTYIVNHCPHPFDVLRIAGIGYEERAKFPDLPSWVPDWSQVDRVFMVDRDYSAGISGSTSIIILPSNDSALALEVYCFDRVGAAEASTKLFQMQSSWTTVDEELYQSDWYRTAENLVYTSRLASARFRTAPAMHSAFVQTMTGNRRTYDSESPTSEQQESDYKDFQKFAAIKRRWRAGMAENDIGTDDDKGNVTRWNASTRRFLHFSGQVLIGKRFCITQQGRLAVVPPYCRQDDVFCVIAGSRVPYVLRQVKDIGWRIVGSCYVHGSMHGEECGGMRQTTVVT